MNPFDRLRARVLLAGALAVVLAVTVALPRQAEQSSLPVLIAYPLVLLWSVGVARRYGVDLRRLAGARVPPDQAVAILALIPAMVAVNYGITWVVYIPLSWLNPQYVREWLQELDRLFPERTGVLDQAGFLVAVIGLAPIVEELLFRGLLLHRWGRRFGVRRGVVLTTIAFAMLHASPVSAFLSGVGLAFIYLRTGSLPLTMGAHAFNNFIAAVVLPRFGGDTPPGVDALTDFQQGTLPGLFAFFTGAIILWLGRQWYLPRPGAPLPYDRLGSGLPAPGSMSPGPQDPLEPGTRNLELSEDCGMTQGKSELATLAGGCFWCLEAAYQQLRGVSKVTSGYAGGSVPNPTYQAVCGGDTGHAEVVQLEYDPAEISYRELLEVFFVIHDPTTRNRQGADVGTQYRSAIFYHDPGQKAAAEQLIAELNAEQLWDAPIVTEVVPLDRFYPAEAYHHNYFARNPSQPYCLGVVAPKVAKVRSRYASRLKAR